jgi:very-short-patch-repair endonuclease
MEGLPSAEAIWHAAVVHSRDTELLDTARKQRGMFSMSQAQAFGFARSTIQARFERGVYERIHPGVYSISGVYGGWHRDVVAAILTARPLAGASHATAAKLWNLTDRKPERIEIVTSRHLRSHRLDFVVHESKDLREIDIVDVKGIPTTSAVRTVVDLGASRPYWFVEKCIDSGLRMKLFSASEVDAFIGRVARSGRNGVGTARPIIEQRFGWATNTESELEDLFRRVVLASGFPMPEAQFVLNDDRGSFVGRFDFVYEDERVLVELDSERWHMDQGSFRRDREKQNLAHALGWTVYRFTWSQLVDHPDEVRAILASASTKYRTS